jgi:hypothetical protein
LTRGIREIRGQNSSRVRTLPGFTLKWLASSRAAGQ